MESVYWVLTWACHRKCVHCYDDRFRPYVRDELDRVIGEGEAAFTRIIANLPAQMRYRDPAEPDRERIGRIILAGGEVLLDPVRERLFLPALEGLQRKYGDDGARISIQTTGDLIEPEHIDQMLARGVWLIAISGMDDFHVGLEGDKREALMARIRAMMAAAGVEEVRLGGKKGPNGADYRDEPGPFFLFFGAQPKSWIGELWPRGRAFANGLSSADYGVNFCARQSGGKGFLDWDRAGSEISIEPDGSIYPCCLKTKSPLGSLVEEPLLDILASLKGHPALEAINRGDPEGMGEAFGWDRAAFRAASETIDPQGQAFANPCLGCDRFFQDRLGAVLDALRRARLSARAMG